MGSNNVNELAPETSSASCINNASLYEFQLSLISDSNLVSKVLLSNVCNQTKETFDNEVMDRIQASANALLGNSDKSNMRTWKSSLSNYDAKSIFREALPSCLHCSLGNTLVGLEHFKDNTCTHNKVNNGKTSNQTSEYRDMKQTLTSDVSSQESLCMEDQNYFKPKFTRQRPKNIVLPATTSKYVPIQENRSIAHDVYVAKEENDSKAHKSNVAKITFRTAKETLLATNPAAKKTLGASRKAQGKFVSPMIGAQEKQEPLETETSDERLKHIDPKMIELIESEIIDKGTPIGWDDIAGLYLAKSVIQEAVVWPLLRPDIFTGLRRPPKGILLFGPPGTGKTLIGKCIASQCHATFFSISASSLTSKWIGDGEKMVRALFAVATCHQPAVIFIDEIDSLLTQRSDSEHEATRRIKTEFLVQFDGAATGEDDRLLIVGATNRPQELDEAARRRLVKRLYIPLPDTEARKQIVINLLQNETNELTDKQMSEVAALTEGYSGADMKSLCSEAAMGPIRAVPFSQIVSIDRNKVRPVCLQDFISALQRVKPSVSQDDLGQYVKWNQTYGQGF